MASAAAGGAAAEAEVAVVTDAREARCSLRGHVSAALSWLASVSSTTTLVVYLALGAFAYNRMEGWSTTDSVYFLIVTMTTVGYGDFCPQTTEGKLFTCVYALLGITLGFRAIAPLAEYLLLLIDNAEKHIFKWLERCRLIEPHTDMTTVDALADSTRNVSYWRSYSLALIGPGFVLVIGIVLAQWLEGLNCVDSIYWTIVTMTTIGYGDITPSNPYSKVATACFLPLAVVSLANGITRVSMINLRRKIRETDQAKIADKLLLKECCGNPDETLTEAEFLVSVLKENDIVDDVTLNTIRAEFRELVATGEGAYETRVLDSRAVFLQLQADGRIGHREPKQPFGTSVGNVSLVDTANSDMGYAEWRKHHWEVQVQEHGQRREPTTPKSTKPSPQRKSSVFGFNFGSSKQEDSDKLQDKAQLL